MLSEKQNENRMSRLGRWAFMPIPFCFTLLPLLLLSRFIAEGLLAPLTPLSFIPFLLFGLFILLGLFLIRGLLKTESQKLPTWRTMFIVLACVVPITLAVSFSPWKDAVMLTVFFAPFLLGFLGFGFSIFGSLILFLRGHNNP